MQPSALICIRHVQGKGRGVFARASIDQGALIERAPVLLVPIEHLVGGLYSPILARFFYLWNRRTVAISLGYGSLYNHSFKPNAHYQYGKMVISYTALRDIARGEEITINYNGDPGDKSPVGFNVVELRGYPKRGQTP
jgi:SET domain-containing protein